MSMVCGFTSVSDETLKKIQENPLLYWRLIAPDDPKMYLRAMNEGKRGFWSLFFKKKSEKSNAEVPGLPLSKDEGKDVYLDKAWHGIHFLLARSAWEGDWPFNFIVAGGEVIEESDNGYGPSRFFSASQVQEIHKLLSAISKEDFEGRFVPEEMMKEDIYPTIWDRPKEEDDTLKYLAEYFLELKQFIEKTEKAHLGAIVSLS